MEQWISYSHFEGFHKLLTFFTRLSKRKKSIERTSRRTQNLHVIWKIKCLSQMDTDPKIFRRGFKVRVGDEEKMGHIFPIVCKESEQDVMQGTKMELTRLKTHTTD